MSHWNPYTEGAIDALDRVLNRIEKMQESTPATPASDFAKGFTSGQLSTLSLFRLMLEEEVQQLLNDKKES